VGIAGRRGNRAEAIDYALSDAARKVALYYGIHGQFAAVLNQGLNILDYYQDTAYDIRFYHDPAEYKSALVYDETTDIVEQSGQVYVVTSLSGVPSVPAYESVFIDGIPSWVAKYGVTIPGFMAGVGVSRNKGTPQATYQASYENALVYLLPQLSTRITGSVIDVTGSRYQENITTSEGDLKEVMILETWLDTRSNSIWTLIVAQAGS
jgi:hypothetical protein